MQFKQVQLTHIQLGDSLEKALDTLDALDTQGYQVSIEKSIARILTTRIGERVMRPDFGSYLYLLRDRDFNSEWRILATQYIFEALKKWEPRVRFKRLNFNIDALTGLHQFYLELAPNE